MAGSTDSRILWAGLLAAPLILLGFAGAVTVWPERVVGVMDAVQRAWTPAPGVDSARLQRTMVRPPPPLSPTPPPVFRGVVRTPDGEPYRGGYTLSVLHRRGGSLLDHDPHAIGGTTASGPHMEPEFSVPMVDDSIFVAVAAQGYAPRVLGPHLRDLSSTGPAPDRPEGPGATGAGADARPPEPVDVLLAPGFPHEVRVVDAQGAPILGAEVSASLVVERWPLKLLNPLRTDDQGRAVFAALSEAEYEFEANVHDYRYPDDAVPALVKPGGSTTIALERGPVSGVALDEEGRPVADAVLLVEAEMGARLDVVANHPFNRVVLARSDAEGRFRLPALHDESTYLIRAEGPDGSLGFAPGVRRRGGEVKITLRPMRTVRGALSSAGSGAPRFFTIKRSVPTGFEVQGPGGDTWSQIRVNRSRQVGPDGRFEYPAWGSVDTELVVDGRSIPVPWPPTEEPVRIDVAPASPPTERTIRIQFLADPAIRPIRGAMTLHLDNAPPERAHQDVTRVVEIREESAVFRCLSDESFSFDSSAVPGFWAVPGRISGGGPDGERVADVRVFASGSIAGRVLDVDGKPVGPGATIRAPFDPEWARGVFWDRLAPTRGMTGGDMIAMQQRREKEVRSTAVSGTAAEEAKTDAEGRFEIPAFPLDVPTRLGVRRGNASLRGDVLRLAPGAARKEVEFRMPRRAAASIRVVDPEGRPIPGARAAISQKTAEPGQDYRPAGETDADGRWAVDDLVEGSADDSVIVSFAADFQTIVAPLAPGGPPLELRAERGAALEGRVVEAVTGWPIPGLTLYARPPGASMDAEARTDADGRFRITTLPPGPVRLGDRRGLRWVSSDLTNARAGSGRPVVLRAIDLRDTDPQPRPVPMF